MPPIRIARPTDQLQTVVAFYRDGLGLGRQSDGVVAETFALAVNQNQLGPNNRRLGFQSNHLIKVQNVANFAAPQPMYPAETLTDHTIRMRRFVYFVL
jgi:hypothetical protein